MKINKLFFGILLLFLGSFHTIAQSLVPWTGKFQLVLDENDPTSFLVQIVPDVDGYSYLGDGTEFTLILDPTVNYDVTIAPGVGDFTYSVLSTGAPATCNEAVHVISKGPVQVNFAVFAGVPFNIARFKATNNDCTAGAKARLYSGFNFDPSDPPTGDARDECESLIGFVDNGLDIAGDTVACTGIITNSTNPLICPCLEILPGGDWNKSFTKAQVAQLPFPIIDTYLPITVPGTDAGMFFDIYELDNSFNLKINGISIITHGTSHEAQFDIGTPAAPLNNIRFLDEDLYGHGNAQPIWKIKGVPNKPAVRVEVSSDGKVTLYGSKVSEGPLYELRTYNGAIINDVIWDTGNNNTVEVTQDAYGWTKLKGKVYGVNMCADGFYKITKISSFDNSPPFNPGDLITYTIQVKNMGNEDVYDVIVTDPLLGGTITTPPTGDTNGIGILNVGEIWIYTVTYPITADDIARRGVYNLAKVFGKDFRGLPIPIKKSFDPDGLQPGDPEYDPNCPTCTYTPITGDCDVIYPIVSEDPFYWVYNYGCRGCHPPVTNAGTVVGTNDGFVFDIYRLDNSFNISINGTNIATQELQFESKLTSGINMQFANGVGQYEVVTPSKIYNLIGNQEFPMMRVKVSAAGVVTMFGSKTSGGELLLLEPKPGTGNAFNAITWNNNPNQLNNIIVSQNVHYRTIMDGFGYGSQINCNPDRPSGDQQISVTGDKVTYYPNPVKEILYVQGNTSIEQIEIYNLLGHRAINLKPRSNDTEISMEGLQAGVYLMKVTTEGKTETHRVIKN